MKYIKYAVILFVLLGICMIAPAASWDIGAVQLEGGATDIGAVQESAAVIGGLNMWFFRNNKTGGKLSKR